ncbi:hypothetical protein ABZ370_40675 [Streptomyces sp. NPDC005962]|uniref:hypothetical protein n=1 Tax=Streptomyces sp. NPDC005962 TaxID=3154466 RepID=UPI0033FFCDD6
MPPAPGQDSGLTVDAGYVGPEYAGVVVLVEDGYLSLLEIYSATGEPVITWPDPRFLDL